jgi:HSP90 family molecular chaperone
VEDKRNHLERGTQITLYLKDDALEFLEDNVLIETIEKHSQFVSYPIYFWKTTVVEKKVPKEEPIDITEDDEAEDGDTPPEEEIIKEETTDWVEINANKPIWLKDPKTTEKQDYIDFYSSLEKTNLEPLTWLHFVADGGVHFKSILFVPKKKSATESFGSNGKKEIKLFVKRVFITDEIEDFLPSYLK